MSKNYTQEFKDFLESKSSLNHSRTTLIVDGLNLFIRSFSVVPTLNDNGEHIGAIIGFFNVLRKLSREVNLNHIVIAFDGKGGNQRRRKLYKEYKEKRLSVGVFNRFEPETFGVDEGESFKRQLSLLLSILDFLPIHVLSMDSIEADDVIAYISNEIVPKDETAIIASSDKDYYQLIKPNISVYSLHKKILVTDKNVFDVLGFSPENYLTLRCFTGDSSDNIKGVSRVGEKTLLKHFNIKDANRIYKVDDIINEAQTKINEGSKVKLYHSIIEEVPIIYRNYELMQLEEPPISGLLSSHIRQILGSPPSSFNRLKFHELMITNGIDYKAEDVDLWSKLSKGF